MSHSNVKKTGVDVSSTPSARLKKVCISLLLLFFCGLAYGIFVMLTNLAVPCPFFLVTGLKCPSCGVTSMSLALLRLDFSAAFAIHPLLFSLLPVLFFLLGRFCYIYVSTGKKVGGRLEKVLSYFIIILLVIWFFWVNFLL